MCIGYRHISVPNMKFLCLILWLGEVFTDTNDANANTNDTHNAQRSKYDCVGLFGMYNLIIDFFVNFVAGIF